MPKQVQDLSPVPSCSYPPSLFHSSINFLYNKYCFAQSYSYKSASRNYTCKMNYTFTAKIECSSGCESGWTSYLENSYVSSKSTSAKYANVDKFVEGIERIKEAEEEEEEDLSMVSDASSGPPLFHENDYNSNKTYNAATIEEPALLRKNARIEKGRKNRRPKIKKQSSLLDDTASSSVFDFSNNNFDSMNNEAALRPKVQEFSQGYSTSKFQRESTYHEHYGFFHPCISDGDQYEIIFRSSDDAESCNILGRGQEMEVKPKGFQ